MTFTTHSLTQESEFVKYIRPQANCPKIQKKSQAKVVWIGIVHKSEYIINYTFSKYYSL